MEKQVEVSPLLLILTDSINVMAPQSFEMSNDFLQHSFYFSFFFLNEGGVGDVHWKNFSEIEKWCYRKPLLFVTETTERG